MRTTIRLDDALLRRAKAAASASGKSLNALIEDAVRAALAPRRAGARVSETELPTYDGGSLQPGVDLDDSAALLDLMEGGSEPHR
jgi:Arc/MetJ family transcription regulator